MQNSTTSAASNHARYCCVVNLRWLAARAGWVPGNIWSTSAVFKPRSPRRVFWSGWHSSPTIAGGGSLPAFHTAALGAPSLSSALADDRVGSGLLLRLAPHRFQRPHRERHDFAPAARRIHLDPRTPRRRINPVRHHLLAIIGENFHTGAVHEDMQLHPLRVAHGG